MARSIGTSAQSLQLDFLRAQDALVSTGRWNRDRKSVDYVGNAVLTQSELRLEQSLTANTSVINFPILESDGGSQRATENRLKLQDTFFCSYVQMYIAKAASPIDTNFKLNTYPNGRIFPLGGDDGTGEAPLYNLYNGTLNIKVNKQEIVLNYPVYDFLNVYESQQTSAGGQGVLIDEFDSSDVSVWMPTVNMIGSSGINVSINMPAGIPTGNLDANTIVVLKFRGILAQNTTIIT